MRKIEVKTAHDYTQAVNLFYREYGIKRVIGISGGAEDKLRNVPDGDPLQDLFKHFQEKRLDRILDDFMQPLRGMNVAILSGGTAWGVPCKALEAARRYGFKTLGVLPKVGERYALAEDLVDLRIIVEPYIGNSAWSDEAAVWTNLVDGVLLIGGAAGTLAEAAHLMKINESIVKRGEQRPKFIVPLHGTGGVADQLVQLWAKPEIRDMSMPRTQIHTGHDAAHALIDALDLYVDFDESSHNDGNPSRTAEIHIINNTN